MPAESITHALESQINLQSGRLQRDGKDGDQNLPFRKQCKYVSSVCLGRCVTLTFPSITNPATLSSPLLIVPVRHVEQGDMVSLRFPLPLRSRGSETGFLREARGEFVQPSAPNAGLVHAEFPSCHQAAENIRRVYVLRGECRAME